MAKFRNLLVHRYAVVETKRLHRITKEDLKDIRDYIKSVLDFLSKE